MAELCPHCGLCCNGVIFANVQLQAGEERTRLESLGLPVCAPASALRPPYLTQPCAAFDGRHCRIYAERPQYCRQFECVLLKSVRAGRTDTAAALRIIRTARERADKVWHLLRALGDADEQLSLSARFRRTGKRLKAAELDEATAETYSQLTLAVHDLNLLLGEAFYPGSPNRSHQPRPLRNVLAFAGAAFALLAGAQQLRADQVELQNGDRYHGHVVSISTNTVVIQSDALGTLRVPRSKVANITLSPAPAAASPALPSASKTQAPPPSAQAKAAAPKASSMFSGLDTNSFLVQQVQKQLLSDAGGEANSKFNELLGGLISGKLDMEDIRAQAKAAADQLRTLQRESGEETGLATGTYLAILDHFLKETEPTAPATNRAAPPAKPKAETAPEKE